MKIYRKFTCDDCYWSDLDQCDGLKTCDYFKPTSEAEDTYIDLYIEANRKAFSREWAEYMRFAEDGE